VPAAQHLRPDEPAPCGERNPCHVTKEDRHPASFLRLLRSCETLVRANVSSVHACSVPHWWSRAHAVEQTCGVPSTFGFALDDDELAGIQSALAQVGRLATAEQVSDRVAALVGPVQRDLAIVAATGRWDVDAPLHADYVPGDVVGLRMRHAAVIMGTGAAIVRAGSDAPPLERTDVLPGLSLAAALYDASCYFLPVTSATGIMGSHPPMAADLVGLRLPFPVVAVYFGADLVIPERLMEWPPDLALRLAESRAASQPVVARSPEAASTISLGESIIGDISARGGLLSAVILFAD